MRKIIFYLALILVVNISFLFSPPPVAEKGPSDICIYAYVHLGPHMGFPANCDIFSFLSASVNPGLLFKQGYVRQSRPGYILLTTVIGYSIYYITWPFHAKMDERLGARVTGHFQHPEKKVLYGCMYAGAVLINISILLIALLLLEKIAFRDPRMAVGSSLFPFMAILLLSNPVCKAFFWTVHQQLFTILTPVFCVYLALSSRKYAECLRSTIFFSLLSGLLLLFYGNFMLSLPVILFSRWYAVRIKARKISIVELFRSLAVILCFFSWTILWIVLLKIKGTTLYNHEIEFYREFIWIADTLKDSWTSFVTRLGSNTRQFLATIPVLFPTLLLSMILVIWKWNSFRSTAGPFRPDSFRWLAMPRSFRTVASGSDRTVQWAAVALVSVEFLLFYWLIGSYFERLTAVFNSLLVCMLTMWLMYQKPDRLLRIFLFIAVLGIHLYWMSSYGPFS